MPAGADARERSRGARNKDRLSVEDCKGARPRDLSLRLKLMKALYGIDVYLSEARRA